MSANRLLLAALSTLSIAIVTVAQDLSCSGLIDQALTRLGEHCADLERNSLCYGHGQVEAAFSADYSTEFSQPSDRAPITMLTGVESSGLALDTATWGIAVIRLGAHLPATYAGPGIIVMLMGDAQLRHDVDLARIAEIEGALSTATLKRTTLYAQPSIIAESAGQLEPETIAQVDAISGDGNWLRVIKDDRAYWAESADLARLQAMDSLPAIDTGDPFALRYFSFASSTELPECAEAEPMLVIQTPPDVPANLRVNGADIHVDSMISFQQLHGNALGMTVHRGQVTTISGEIISQGHSVIGILGGGQILAWSGALPASESELARGERAQTALNNLARGNGWDEFDTDMPAGAIIHTVAYGDTLYAIARLYDVPLDDIVAANTQTSALRLLVGEELVIPNPGSGYAASSGVAVRSAPAPAQTESIAPDCSGLRLASPLDMASGSASPYYWDGIPAASGYRVNVYDHGSGNLVGTFTTGAHQTTVSISAGQLGIGGALQWEVEALRDGQTICSTGLSAPLPHISS